MTVEDAWHMTDQVTGEKVRTKRHGRGKRWRVRNRGARTRSFHKKTDAEAHNTSVKNALYEGKKPFDHTKGRELFKLYARKCVTERYSNSNSRNKNMSLLENHLIPFYGEKRMCDITASTVSAGRAQLRKKPKKYGKNGEKLSASTVEQIDQLLVTIMLSATKVDKLIAENPCEEATPVPSAVKRKIKVWEQSLTDRVIDAVPEQYQAMPLVSATCGHRPGESFAVAEGDIDFLRRRIGINHQVQWVEKKAILVPPKGDKVRSVPLPNVTSMALAAHLAQYGTISVRCTCCDEIQKLLFSMNGLPIARHTWDKKFWHPAFAAVEMEEKHMLRELGIDLDNVERGQHQLRHVFASTLIEGGATPLEVMELMGHADITITMSVYGHLFERSADKTRGIVDAAFSARAYPLRTAQDR